MEFDFLLVPRLVALILATVSALLFCVLYEVTTSGRWRDTESGVHLMVFTAACGLILTYATLAVLRVVPAHWTPVASLVIYLTLAVLFIWRIVLLIRAQRRKV